MRRRRVLRGLVASAATGLAGCVHDARRESRRGSGENASDGDGAVSTEVAGTSFAVRRTGCGAASDDASVRVGDDAVTVDGTITATDPGKTAELRGATVDGSGRLLISIGTAVLSGAGGDEEGCRTVIGYRASVSYEGRRPSDTAVYHDGVRVGAADGVRRIRSVAFDRVARPTGRVGDAATPTRSADGDRLVVEGSIPRPEGCAAVALDDLRYDADEDRLTVALVTVEETKGPCDDDADAMAYRVGASVDGPWPARVAVTHDGRYVAEADWSSSPPPGNRSS